MLDYKCPAWNINLGMLSRSLALAAHTRIKHIPQRITDQVPTHYE
jgi:hypothetical protein